MTIFIRFPVYCLSYSCLTIHMTKWLTLMFTMHALQATEDIITSSTVHSIHTFLPHLFPYRLFCLSAIWLWEVIILNTKFHTKSETGVVSMCLIRYTHTVSIRLHLWQGKNLHSFRTESVSGQTVVQYSTFPLQQHSLPAVKMCGFFLTILCWHDWTSNPRCELHCLLHSW